jgi:hypothetical protein
MRLRVTRPQRAFASSHMKRLAIPLANFQSLEENGTTISNDWKFPRRDDRALPVFGAREG